MENVEHAKSTSIMMNRQSVVNLDVVQTNYLTSESEDVFVLAVITGLVVYVENVLQANSIYQDKRDVLQNVERMKNIHFPQRSVSVSMVIMKSTKSVILVQKEQNIIKGQRIARLSVMKTKFW